MYKSISMIITTSFHVQSHSLIQGRCPANNRDNTTMTVVPVDNDHSTMAVVPVDHGHSTMAVVPVDRGHSVMTGAPVDRGWAWVVVSGKTQLRKQVYIYSFADTDTEALFLSITCKQSKICIFCFSRSIKWIHFNKIQKRNITDHA